MHETGLLVEVMDQVQAGGINRISISAEEQAGRGVTNELRCSLFCFDNVGHHRHAVSIFILMHRLISGQGGNRDDVEDLPGIRFGPVEIDDRVEGRVTVAVRHPPPPPETPPPPPQMEIAQMEQAGSGHAPAGYARAGCINARQWSIPGQFWSGRPERKKVTSYRWCAFSPSTPAMRR